MYIKLLIVYIVDQFVEFFESISLPIGLFFQLKNYFVNFVFASE
jgi:hypothetical protein